uniref:Conjugal transfer protein n=1 Tax=Strongyloides venezuelensis TaxID=75913 RepID=A0A0K0FZB7_STRVS
MIFGIDKGNKLLIEWIETNPPRPKEHVYKNNVIQGCNKVPNPIILENNLKYSIIYKEQLLSISEAQQLFQKLCQIRLLFISKCPNWDSSIQDDMNGIDNAIHRKHDDSTKLTLETISRIGQYQLPEREYNDDSLNNEKFYNKRIILTFNNLKGYTQTLESQIAALLVDKNTMTELLKVKTQALTHSETVRETLKHNGEEIVTLSKSLK